MSEDTKKSIGGGLMAKPNSNSNSNSEDRKASAAATAVAVPVPVPVPIPTKKVIIKSADMLPDMQKEAVDIAVAAFEKHNVEKDVAEQIKKEFDKRHGPTWHCIVGRNFGSSRLFKFFRVGDQEFKNQKNSRLTIEHGPAEFDHRSTCLAGIFHISFLFCIIVKSVYYTKVDILISSQSCLVSPVVNKEHLACLFSIGLVGCARACIGLLGKELKNFKSVFKIE